MALGAGGTSYQRGRGDDARAGGGGRQSSGMTRKTAAAGAVSAAPPAALLTMLILFLNWLKSFFFSAAAKALALLQALWKLAKAAAAAVWHLFTAPFVAAGALVAKTAGAVFGVGSLLASAPVATAAVGASAVLCMAAVAGTVVGSMDFETQMREGSLSTLCAPVSAAGGSSGRFTGKGVPAKAIPWIENAAKHSQDKIPAAFFASIMDRETDFRPDLFSSDTNGGTWGLFQINAQEWAKATGGGSFDSPDITDPMIHTEYGAKYFDSRLDAVRGMREKNPNAAYATGLTDLEALMIAHNAGEGNLQKYPNLPPVTSGYLKEFREKFTKYGGGKPTGNRDGSGSSTRTISHGPGAGEATHLQLGAVKPHVQDAANLLYARFKAGPGSGLHGAGGYRPGDNIDPAGHPAGLAVDFMVGLNSGSKQTGDALAKYVIDNAAQLNGKYVIWQQRIWNIEKGDTAWRGMEDRGSATQNHRDHVHVSFKPSGSITGIIAAAPLSPGTCATDGANSSRGGGAAAISFNDGGMTGAEAQKVVDLYNKEGDTFLRKRYHGGGPGQCNGDYRRNCVSFSIYFMNKYTTFQRHAPGNGVATARSIARLTGKRVSGTPRPYSVFSYANGGAGHTGVVFGVENDGTLIIGNAAYCQWGGQVARIPQEKWKSGRWEFVDVSDLMKSAPTA
ncbi:transglycosylase SLT domain-containing protein [Actinomadura syzygii]|uniref:Lytic transglycosylase domain-containing protein n=1 Tax=Actinomadura syzygii TaxID=1427538 RepID=A0A5D0TT65_9ACTN|nr:transglycosylase SLT domain-containing protein [Actinomadura syzygii]TYC08536.1 lytic transglycosylase domain-containing protein [Actinomadura syzygii]